MAEQPLIDISPENWRIVRDILQRHVPDREVWAFGSRAKWTAKEFSDLDIAIIGDEPLSIGVMAELTEAFQESALPFKVDIVDWAAITQSFRKVVEKDKIVVNAVSQPRETSFIRFGDLFSEPQRNGLTRPKKIRGTGLPMVNMGELFAYSRIKNIQMDLVPVSLKEKSFLLEKGDLLFARQSLVRDGAGQCSIFLGNTEPTVFESHIIRCRLNPDVADPEFYYYLFLAPKGREAVEAIIEQGAGAAGIRGSDLVNIQVPYFPLEQQKRVSQILAAIDDRIDLLRETNTTLEAIAQALFKSWFVDFDPVRAKAEGREPEGVPPAVAELFPSEFEDSELGEIPKGWSVSTFGEIADVSGGGTPSTKDDSYWNGGTHYWATPKDLSALDFPVLLDTERKITDTGLAKISSGLLPVGTLLMSSRAPIGYVAIAEVPTAINQGFIAMQPKNGTTNLFLLSLIRWRMDDIKNRANGSTFMEISKSAFRPIQVVKPAPKIVEQFDVIVRTLYNRLVLNMRQIETLASTRDSLLPRLMSGQLMPVEADS